MKKLILFISVFVLGAVLLNAQEFRITIPEIEGITVSRLPQMFRSQIKYVASDGQKSKIKPTLPVVIKIKGKDFELLDTTKMIGVINLESPEMKHILEAIEKDSVEVTFYSEQYETVSEKVKLRLPCLISVRYNLNQRISD